MKTLFILSLLSLFAAQVQAKDTKKLAPCRADEIAELKESDLQNSLMLNSKKEVVGVFSWDDNGIHAEVCEYMSNENDLTISSEWYYWNSDSSPAPSTWKKGDFFRITQDEGIAEIDVLKASKNGQVTIKFSVLGWDESSEEKVVKEEVLTLTKSL